MSGEQEITQNRWGSKTRFQFGEDQLEFSLRDFSGEAASALKYENINLENKSTVTINVARRYYPLILIVGLLGAMILQISTPTVRELSLLPLLVAVLAYFVLRYLKVVVVKFTILRPASGAGTPIRIIHDKKHDEVLQRIKSSWIARLRKLHLAVDFARDVKLEAQKFKWLLDHKVISDAEYQDAIARLSPPASSSATEGEPAIH